MIKSYKEGANWFPFGTRLIFPVMKPSYEYIPYFTGMLVIAKQSAFFVSILTGLMIRGCDFPWLNHHQ